ncbi:MAG TPA: hypothetical protein VHB99_14205, partial [Pirellulales bacterium]|nr:hypothetical protein [Pirellulales bacterium]
EKRKLLRVVISPKIKMPSGSTASIEHVCGTGLDRQGEIKPATIEIEVSTRVETAIEQLTVTSICCLETIGKGESRRSCESFIGGKLRPGESRGLLQYVPLEVFKDIQTSSSVRKLLFVKATIVKPKSIEDLPPAPRFEGQVSNAEKEDR